MTFAIYPSTAESAFQQGGTLGLSVWRYFLAQEDAFIQTLNYVELTSSNFGTKSIEYSRQLVVNGAEFENVVKLLSIKKFKIEPGNISEYKEFLLSEYPEICQEAVNIDKYRLIEHPFESWDTGAKLSWWDKYTGLKHRRHASNQYADMESVLSSLCALIVLEKYLYDAHEESGKSQLYGSKLCRVKGMLEYSLTNGS